MCGKYHRHENEKWNWPLVSLTSIFSASSCPNIKSKVSFEILRTSRFQNWLYFLNLVKIWGSYCQKTNLGNFVLHPLFQEWIFFWVWKSRDFIRGQGVFGFLNTQLHKYIVSVLVLTRTDTSPSAPSTALFAFRI